MEAQQRLPAVIPNDGWNDTDPSDRLIQGDLIKCVDGKWTDKDGLPVPERLLAMATVTALQLWKSQKPVQTIVKQPGKPWPKLDELNAEIPESDWEVGLDGEPRPPWQRQFVVYLLDPDTAASYTFANGTAGANQAVSHLKDAVKWQRALRGDFVVPLVELANRPMKMKFGTKLRPHFQVVEWRDMGMAFTPPPAQLSPPDDGVPFNDSPNFDQ